MTNGRHEGDQPPGEMPQVTPPNRQDSQAYLFTATYENAQALGRIEGTLTGVANQLTAIDKRLDMIDTRLGSVETKVTWARGFLAAAVVLIPLSFGLIWWALGTQIEEALDIERTQGGQTDTERGSNGTD